MTRDWVEESAEVFYTGQPVTMVSRDDIDLLKKYAAVNPRRQARLCAHLGINDDIHEMFIVHSRGNYVRPHKHLGKIESFHVIEGRLSVVIFEDDGRIRSIIQMSDYVSGSVCYYRLSESLFHTVIPVSDTVVFHETTNGPFRRSGTNFASWAPAEGENGCPDFARELLGKIKQNQDK